MFPWQITLYKNGYYMCGATLVQRHWILTHADCAVQAADMDRNSVTVIARAGGSREHLSLGAYDQLRRVVFFAKVPKTSMVLGLVEDGFDLSEYINPVCIPSVTWVPLHSSCFITGKNGETLNHAHNTQVIGVCDYVDDNNYKFCTQQVSST